MKFLRRSAFAISVFAFFILSAWTIFAFTVRDKYVVPILMYHSIIKPDSNSELNLVGPASFEHQMAFLKNNGFHVLMLSDLVEGMHKARMFNRKTVVITF